MSTTHPNNCPWMVHHPTCKACSCMPVKVRECFRKVNSKFQALAEGHLGGQGYLGLFYPPSFHKNRRKPWLCFPLNSCVQRCVYERKVGQAAWPWGNHILQRTQPRTCFLLRNTLLQSLHKISTTISPLLFSLCISPFLSFVVFLRFPPIQHIFIYSSFFFKCANMSVVIHTDSSLLSKYFL